MGVLPNHRKVFFPSSDSDNNQLVDSTSDSDTDAAGDVAPPSVPRRQAGVSPRTLMSPASARKKFCGHKLTLKKGRRSRHRFENERDLFSSVGIVNSEEAPEGWDIAHESRSHFSELLMTNNKELLEQFMTNQENPASHCKAEVKRKLGERLQPEEAYLTIPVSLRAAMKKHLPWGILEAVDNDICSFFEAEPSATFVSQSMSSFERLLAHACSVYYQLKSFSCDIDGVRTLKIENPFSTFEPMDPTMTKYLMLKRKHYL